MWIFPYWTIVVQEEVTEDTQNRPATCKSFHSQFSGRTKSYCSSMNVSSEISVVSLVGNIVDFIRISLQGHQFVHGNLPDKAEEENVFEVNCYTVMMQTLILRLTEIWPISRAGERTL